MRSLKTNKQINRSLLAFIIYLYLSSFSFADPPKNKEWILIWSDEFDGEKIDFSRWSYFDGWGVSPWREAYYTESDAYLENGFLVIRSRVENDSLKTSGLTSRKKFEHRYGYFEIRAKMTELESLGQWVAFWLFVDDPKNYDGAPENGVEIDIMEYPVGWDTDTQSSGEKTSSGVIWDVNPWRQDSKRTVTSGLREDFHTFGLEWDENVYKFYIDGEEVFYTNRGVSHSDQYILLTLEIMAGFSDLDPDIHDIRKYTHLLPDYWFVDYIRVYIPSEMRGENVPEPENLKIFN